MPIETPFGPQPLEIFARVAARMGEPDRAIAAIGNYSSPFRPHVAHCFNCRCAAPTSIQFRSTSK